jgi:hypothetical protein
VESHKSNTVLIESLHEMVKQLSKVQESEHVLRIIESAAEPEVHPGKPIELHRRQILPLELKR